MPPRPAVHPSKKEAVFQLCNFLCATSVEKLQDLADGKILLETIQAKFSLFSNDCPSTSSSEEIKASEIKVDFLHSKEESSDINSRNESEETKFNPAKEDDILLRYNNIQKFIDDHYEINSEIIISYDECRKSSELELIKVTIFVLSEIVKNLNDVNNEHLRTLFHLDTKYQIELKDIFKVFITEREKLTRNEIETLLSKSAKNASPTVTPRRASSRRTSLKEQKSVSSLECSSAPNEDVFTNSPLKAYFESPIFKKEDILKKNKEIQDMQKLMYAEDEEKERRISEMEKELERKDKDYKQLLKQNIQSLGQKDEEIELLKNSYEELSCKYEKLVRDSNWLNKYHLYRIEELSSQLAEAEKAREKKEEQSIIESLKSFSELPENVSENPPNSIEDALRVEVALLKDRIKNMELKIYTYKKQLSEKLLAELKEKKSPENLNRSYEDIWNELYHERKGEEETAARVIQEDNRILSARLNEATSIIQNLNKEIEALKEQLSRKNRKSNPQKKVSSVATDTGIMNVPELPDCSKIPETEILRKSLSHSKNVEHYFDQSGESCSKIPETEILRKSLSHSKNVEHYFDQSGESCSKIPETEILRKSLSHSKNVEHYFDQSGESYNITDESDNSVPYPCPKKSSEAVLWDRFDNLEIGSPCGINLSRDSFVPENSHLDVINDLRVNNIKIENVEPDIVMNEENKYVLGNLNFDAFLNELKKITKNGSFQKVLQVFGKRQSEINGTNRPKRLDLQELLKMITECVCVAVSLNAESSFANVQDKCCSTDENELCSFNHNLEIDKLKNELQATSQKYEIELKQYKMELEELKKAKITMSYKCQAYEETIRQKSKAIEDLIRKFHEQKIKMENMGKKYSEHKDTISKLLVINKKERIARNTIKTKVTFLQEEKLHSDQLCKLLKEENNHLKQELHNLKVERNKLLREKERQSIVSAYPRDAFPSRESYVGIPNHLSIKSELHSSTFQGTDNESVLSSAFHKSISHYVSENEDDFFDYNSLDSIKKEYEDDRVEELKRRNSLYPIHLQSSYPLEADLETTYASLYVKDGEKVKEEERCSKKRKVDGTADAEPSISSTVETPVSKPKKKMATPKSLQRFLRNIKHKNSLKMKHNGS